MSYLREYEPLTLFDHLNRQWLRPDRFLPANFDDEDSNVFTSKWAPAVDIKEEGNRFVVQADVPGVPAEEIEVTMHNGTLTIKGERPSKEKHEKDGYKRVERTCGSFYRRFSLPDSAVSDNILAKSNDGVLELFIPKQEKVKVKKITVKS